MDFFFIKEQLPPNWFSRVDPYTIPLVAAEIAAQYFLHPVAFGGNTGKPVSPLPTLPILSPISPASRLTLLTFSEHFRRRRHAGPLY